jgi:glycosyltransferase involved in cell wall biosynthesis
MWTGHDSAFTIEVRREAGRKIRAVGHRDGARVGVPLPGGTLVAGSKLAVGRPQLSVGSSRSTDPTVSVVIPALNEAENLPHVLPRIPSWVNEILIVDGHSTDGTAEVAVRLRPEVRVVQQSGRGKGVALRDGFAHATSSIVVMLDADGSMDPAEIGGFVKTLLGGADMAKGSRFLRGGGTSDMPWYRRFGNACFVFLVNRVFGSNYTDLCYGYAAFWSHKIATLQLDCDGFEIETVLNVRALRAGWDVREVPSFEAARVYGTGRLRTVPDGWRVLKALIRETLDHWRQGSLPPVPVPLAEASVLLDSTAPIAAQEPV